jgi:hypothetical protein
MTTWRMKLVGKADVYRFVEIEAADLDAAIELAEKTYNEAQTADQLDGWIVDETSNVHVVTGSWRRKDA